MNRTFENTMEVIVDERVAKWVYIYQVTFFKKLSLKMLNFNDFFSDLEQSCDQEWHH